MNEENIESFLGETARVVRRSYICDYDHITPNNMFCMIPFCNFLNFFSKNKQSFGQPILIHYFFNRFGTFPQECEK